MQEQRHARLHTPPPGNFKNGRGVGTAERRASRSRRKDGERATQQGRAGCVHVRASVPDAGVYVQPRRAHNA